MNEERIERMTALLREHLDVSELIVLDESAKHAGHAGAQDGRGHFKLTITASNFRGLNTLKRHRLVYDVLDDMMKTDIHALSISASDPD
ncbi:MAG: BolA family protein [Gammaproteobacteria bacterium]